MPALPLDRQPKYRRHKASGQAVVTLNGKDLYLGARGTKASKAEYDRLLTIWLANDRRLPAASNTDLTIVELLAAFRKHAARHYRQNGEPTKTLGNINDAIRPLRGLFGRELVREFGPLKLKTLQGVLAQGYSDRKGRQFAGVARRTVNKRIGIIKQVFRWAVSEELAPPSLAHSLDSVAGLQRGRTEARETQPVRPVDDVTVDATLPHLPAVVADMVRFQRLTGCRPAEVCSLRPCDVDTSSDAWSYRPASHKTEHHGRERVIFIGPQAQDILRPYLLREKTANCFSPADSERKLNQDRRAAHKTPMTPSQAARTAKRRGKRPAGAAYTTGSYPRAMHRPCDTAFQAPDDLSAAELTAWQQSHRWVPNQLRHAAATEIRKQIGLQAAQVVLGHSKVDVTQMYAERDHTLAASVAAKIG